MKSAESGEEIIVEPKRKLLGLNLNMKYGT